MATNPLQIHDIVELNELELLLKDFSAATGFPTGLVEAKQLCSFLAAPGLGKILFQES